MRRDIHAAAAGAAAAAAWIAAEPAIRRAVGGTHRELRLVSGLLSPRRGGSGLGLAVHLWPGMAIADRIHPDVRSGVWPRLLTDPGTIAQEVGGHLVFGIVLGALLPDRA